MARLPKLNTEPEVQPQKKEVHRNDHLPAPAGNTVSDTTLYRLKQNIMLDFGYSMALSVEKCGRLLFCGILFC